MNIYLAIYFGGRRDIPALFPTFSEIVRFSLDIPRIWCYLFINNYSFQDGYYSFYSLHCKASCKIPQKEENGDPYEETPVPAKPAAVCMDGRRAAGLSVRRSGVRRGGDRRSRRGA